MQELQAPPSVDTILDLTTELSDAASFAIRMTMEKCIPFNSRFFIMGGHQT